MISKRFVFFLTLLFVAANGQKTYPKASSSVQQKGKGFLSVSVGDTVTLECSYEGPNSVQIFWYKQSFGQKPKLMSTFYGHTTKETFSDEFKSNSRFKLETENQNPHLKISNLKFSDSATYHCISSDSYSLTFLESFRVLVKDPSSYVLTSVDQSSSENIHAGDSVTLNCTVHTGSCDEEHRVYWFKDSEDSHPGLIYTHGGRNDQCDRKNNTQTHSCVYELHIKNLTESHAGIYYCAVVSCGHILFGNGTKLDLTVPLNSVILNTLVGLLTVMSVLVAFLLFLLWKIHKSNNCTSTEERSPAAPLRSSEAENKDAESLHYAAVNVKKSSKTRRQKNNSNTVCVYASVRQQN
ncbi:immunoglobulin kappa light chain-like [Oryzias latipes]|uniref:Ig-like domain-containing protein n=1 Tax=Oryzias latipes TaxID=8090 RepID=H2MXU3_ORYLA|nr:immunoglobulin kappa light chain-like [Oryzias latipes]